MRDFWRGRHVLVTGNTGFKGAWLCLWLEHLGARVSGLALPAEGAPNLYELCAPWTGQTHVVLDICETGAVHDTLQKLQPSVVFHMAAQALVRQAYKAPAPTFATNLMGTVNVLEAMRHTSSVQAGVIVTTDKVYENLERGAAFVETDRLGGKDPYSASKACAEIASSCYIESYFSGANGPAVATARAGNVVGGGDWAIDRLIPDIVRAKARGETLVVRFPQSVRPWQHVLEALAGYLTLAQSLIENPKSTPRALNFGPDPESFLTVQNVIEVMGRSLGPIIWEQAPGPQPAEAKALTLSSSLAKRALDWQPRLLTQETIAWTAEWYQRAASGEHARALMLEQIHRFEARLPAESRVPAREGAARP